MQRMSEQENLFLQIVALNGMKPLAKERTLQSFFHVLRGRKANQTLQDVHLFRLYPYYRLFPHFPREQWEEIVQLLVGQDLIRKQELDQKKTTFFLTQKGEELCRDGREHYQLNEWLELFHHHTWVSEHFVAFWLRIHLTVQTISHLLIEETSFYPLVQDRQIQQFIKLQLQNREMRKRWLDGLFAELYCLLADLPEDVQPLLVKQWAGAAQTGLTIQQLAYQEHLPSSYIRMKWRYGVARMMIQAREKAEEFPLLAALLPEQENEGLQMSKSARETYRLLQRNLSLEEIARIRGITRNTVEDHLVDIALHCQDWDASRFLAEEEKKQILEACARLDTRRLRLIKEELDDRFTYLQIRLALASGEGKA